MPSAPVVAEIHLQADKMPLPTKSSGIVSKWGSFAASSLKKVKNTIIGSKRGGSASGASEDLSITSLISNLESIHLEDRKPLILRSEFKSSAIAKPALITAETPITNEQQQQRLSQLNAIAHEPKRISIVSSSISLQQSVSATPPTPAPAPAPTRAATPVFSETLHEKREFTLSDFEQLRPIGSGSYGSVSLCRHIATGTPCIIKAVSKAYAFAKHEQQHTLNEKEVLAKLTLSGCPFAAYVYGYFQDEKNLYYVLEYVPGGELFTYMVEYDKFTDKGARFFVAQLALVLQHMHSLGIVYRDVKPENMLVDEKGYIKVCDFGFSRLVKRGDRAYTMCGTPEYIAPEILRGKGHGVAVDLWSLGIFAYELLVGRTPFEGSNSRATHVNILSAAVRFPDYVSEPARDFIQSLLVIDETQRLGYGNQFDAVFAHPWMAGLDLEALKRRELQSPIMVSVLSAFDSRNFDACAHEDKSALCAPLTPDLDIFFAGFDDVTREFPVPDREDSVSTGCDVFG